jgi:flagellar hook-associated protein 3 FlgL
MRVASKTIYDTVKFNLANITEELNKANKVVGTGRRIIGLSDDPVGLTQVLNIKSSLSNIEQLRRNMSMGKSWLIAAESALSNVQNQISDAKALCVQMATSTTGSAQRASAAQTVQNTLEEIVSLANTEVSGR